MLIVRCQLCTAATEEPGPWALEPGPAPPMSGLPVWIPDLRVWCGCERPMRTLLEVSVWEAWPRPSRFESFLAAPLCVRGPQSELRFRNRGSRVEVVQPEVVGAVPDGTPPAPQACCPARWKSPSPRGAWRLMAQNCRRRRQLGKHCG